MIRVVFEDGSCSEQYGEGEKDLIVAVRKAIATTGKGVDQIEQIWYPTRDYLDETGEYAMTHLSGGALSFFLDSDAFEVESISISSILSQAKREVERHWLKDNYRDSVDPDLSIQIQRLLNDIESLCSRLDPLACESPERSKRNNVPNPQSDVLLETLVRQYLKSGDTVAFKILLEQAAAELGIVSVNSIAESDPLRSQHEP
jgi:hypothetical protein